MAIAITSEDGGCRDRRRRVFDAPAGMRWDERQAAVAAEHRGTPAATILAHQPRLEKGYPRPGRRETGAGAGGGDVAGSAGSPLWSHPVASCRLRPASLLLAVLLLAGCGGSATPTIRGGGTGGGGAGGTPTGTAAPYATAVAAPDDTVITIHPVMNDPSGPCASVTSTVPISQAPGPCISAWSDLDAASVPGNDVLAATHTSTTVRVAKGVPADQAADIATGFYKSAALEWWALRQPDVKVVEALNPGAYASPVLHAIHDGQSVVSVPSCWLPSTLRVAQLSSDETDFFAGRGYPPPGPIVVLATYAACPGLTMGSGSGATRVEFGNAVPDTAVVAGSVGSPPAIGRAWLTSGVFTCGEQQLAHVCGR